LNEEGTEAAAATAIFAVLASADIQSLPIPEFVADHPFAFMLVNKGNEVIFCGVFIG